MKLYFHPASTTCRPIMLFAAEEKIPLDMQLVDIFTGENYKEPYGAINPNRLVPVLEDGDFRLTESSAILKYLADKAGSAAYPQDLQQRARVNERMDWVNTQFSRDFNYGYIYPQIFPFAKRRSDEAQAAQIEWGKSRSQYWLKVLNDSILAGGNKFIAGDRITLADYLAAPFIGVGEVAGCTFADYPHVQAWLARMKALPSWNQVHEAVNGFAASLKGQTFDTV